MPDRDDRHDHHRDDEPDRHSHSRGAVAIREGSTFHLDVKAALLIGGTIVAIAGSWFEQKMRVNAMDYELRAEITRVENESTSKQTSLDAKLANIQDTLCALAKNQNVTASGCR